MRFIIFYYNSQQYISDYPSFFRGFSFNPTQAHSLFTDSPSDFKYAYTVG